MHDVSEDNYCVHPVSTNEHSKYIEKTTKLLNKNPRKMKQKHHQKIHKLYFIYKSPGAMLVTAERLWNDV